MTYAKANELFERVMKLDKHALYFLCGVYGRMSARFDEDDLKRMESEIARLEELDRETKGVTNDKKT